MQLPQIKGIKFRYSASAELDSLFNEFRLMCNDAIRIAVEYENEHAGARVKNRFQLIELAYPRLKQYGLHSHYILSACEVAFSAYRNKNGKKDPYVKEAFLKLDSQSYLLNNLILRIPTRPRQFIYFVLEGSTYHSSFTDNPTLRRASITITPSGLTIAFSSQAATIDPLGNVGIDVNERNVTWSDSSGETKTEDLSEVADIRERYKFLRAKIAERTRQDRRTGKVLQKKYGRREKNRTSQRIHIISGRIVKLAEKKKFGIVMEKLKGIRKLYRRGNGQGRAFRGRMNSWAFRAIQRQIEYKAAWAGVPVTYVNARGTSRKCPDCGSSLIRVEARNLMCASCRRTEDRDVIASRNILMAASVRAVRPSNGSSEEEPRRQENAGNPLSG